MQGREIVIEIMKEQRISQTELANRLGYKSQGGVWSRLYRGGEAEPKDMTIANLTKFLEVLGYELVVREKGKKKGKEYTIE